MAFARHGAAVACVGRNLDAVKATASTITEAGGRAVAFSADVTDSLQVEAAVRFTVETFGGLDIAHNNAGIFPRPSPLAELDEDVWDQVIRTNLFGAMYSMKHQVRHMRHAGGGVIVNTSSNIGAHGRRAGMAAYASSKAAVSTLTATAALDHISDNIRINAVSPGATATEMSRRAGESDFERSARLQSTVPIGRVGEVIEIVNAVLWLASPASSFLVGQDIVVDGGVTA